MSSCQDTVSLLSKLVPLAVSFIVTQLTQLLSRSLSLSLSLSRFLFVAASWESVRKSYFGGQFTVFCVLALRLMFICAV